MATWTTIPDADLTSGKPGKQYIFRALRDNIDAALSGDPSAPKVQSAAFADGVIDGLKLSLTTVGDYIVADSNVSESSASSAYIKIKEIFVPRSGQARITFNLSTSNSAGTAYGRIYINGVAVGTERSTTSLTSVSFTEDITGIISGDLIQLYIHNNGTYQTATSTFQYKVSNPLNEVITS